MKNKTRYKLSNESALEFLCNSDWLYTQHITNKKSLTEISKILNCDRTTVANYCKKYDIEIRSNTTRAFNDDIISKLNDEEWLREKYEEHKTAKKLANILNVSEQTIARRLSKFNIKKNTNAEIKIEKSSLDKLNDYNWMYHNYVTSLKTSYDISYELNVAYSTVINYINFHNIEIRTNYVVSSIEIQLQNFLTENNIEFVSSDRKAIKPKELDIYIPSRKIAIEINGVYWHSLDVLNDNTDNRKKHINKTEACLENEIELLQFNDIEWIYKKDIVKSMILNKCGLSKNKIFARKCLLSTPTKQEEREFFNTNHLQGFSNSSICYGLKYDDKFVCMISFRTPRYNKEFDYEIIRIASKLNTNVVGGISKLFKHFLKNNENKTVITYADRRYSSGNIYKQLGFAFKHNSNIGYKWCKNNILYNRVQFQKHKLKDKLKIFDESFSESQNMFLNGYRKLYDCGQAVYVK